MRKSNQSLVEKMPERRPSVTNSAWASMRLEQLGLGVREFGEVVKDALKATLVVYDKIGNKVATRPDYRTRAWAAEQLKDVHGWNHVPEQKTDISVAYVQIVQEIKGKSLQELEVEAQRFLPRNRLVDATEDKS